jgi:hypothetical protein
MVKMVKRQAWWGTPVIPALRRLRQEHCEFQISLGYRETLSPKRENNCLE